MIQKLAYLVSNKWLGQLLDILPKNYIFFKTCHSQFLYIEVYC